MSVEQVKAFLAKAKEDSALAQKIKDAEKAYTGDKRFYCGSIHSHCGSSGFQLHG